MSKLDCPIVRDLLPLYIDQVTSPETNQAVEDHLAGCPACRRERDALGADLPEPPLQESATTQQFGTMVRRMKRKETWKAALSVLLVFAVIAGGLFAIFGLPLQVTDNEDVEFYRVYPYENSDGKKMFFLVYSSPLISRSLESSVKQEDGKDILQLNMKRDLFGEGSQYRWEWSYGISVPEWADITEVRLGHEVIWTREANGSDPVPDYVYAYEEFGSIGTIQSWTVELDGKENHTDYPAPFIWAVYKNGSQIVWDLDGNVLRETP
ncbi:zf-HC2 domain-containing protein [Evtepia sp.]|uniref:zf-HC2 domain-containing protein n=1 Tax=Evtepia sp. TaxID=2773933 RepID=UPI003F183B96